MASNNFDPSLTFSGLTKNFNSTDLVNFLKDSNKNFVAHQVKSGIEIEKSKKSDGGEISVEFMLQIDPATGQSTKIYIRTIDEPGGGSDQDKGLEFGIPKELLSTDDPELADKVATQFANMLAEVALQYQKDGSPLFISDSNHFKWEELTDAKTKEAFLDRADELRARNISVYLKGNLIFSPQMSTKARPSLLFNDSDQKSDSMIETLLKRAEYMQINPETYLKNQGINPENPENINTLCNLANKDNKAAHTVLLSVIENQNNASPLAKKLLKQIKNIKFNLSDD